MGKLYSYKEFAEICGKPYNTITANVTRKKVIVDENKKIDISDPINTGFLNKCINAQQKQKVIEEKPIEKKSVRSKNVPETKYSGQGSDIDFEKKQAEIRKIEIDIKLRNLEYSKKKKKIIPINLAVTNINTFLAGTVGKVKNEIDKFIENEFEDSEIALEHKKHVHSLIEGAIKNSIRNAIREMEKESEEYSLMTSW